MPAYKLLPILIVVGLIVLTGLFFFVEDIRPPFVERLFLQAQGLSPAKTPSECLDKFKLAIRKRNYKGASTFCGGEYGEELRRSAKAAKKLGDAVEELLHNAKEVANINAPKADLAVRRLYPFPNDFKIIDLKYKDGADVASAAILLDDGSPVNVSVEDLRNSVEQYRIDERILYAATPYPWDGQLFLKLEGDKNKSWKIYFPDYSVSAAMRERMQYLRDNGGNYVRALDNIKYAIKHEAATKSEYESELKKQLSQAK